MSSSLLPIRRVLISVFNKSKILNFAQSLFQLGIQLLSTDGTAQLLSNAGIKVHKISDYTNFPEFINGRIKTLHHKIYAGILSRKGLDDSIMDQYNIQYIDMIIVNFYPFNIVSKNINSSTEEVLEHIDIGGPNIVRAAAKNYKNIIVIVDHNDYESILNEMNTNHGLISLKTRFILATKAFKYVSQYDTIISDYFNTQLSDYSNKSISNIHTYNNTSDNHFPNTFNCMNLKFKKTQDMRYGENPHQKAALYQEIQTPHTQKSSGYVSTAQQLQGKPLSYNNIIDLDTALECVKTFHEPTCVIVKHANPCGVATSDSIETAYYKAYHADPISAFGGIIALNRPLDKATAQSIIHQNFVEAIIAPDIHQDSLAVLSHKKHIRVLSSGKWYSQHSLKIDFKRIHGGLLLQEYDIATNPVLKIVTNCQPTEKEIQDALFCWKIVRFVKSNAIVCGKHYQTTGIGAGQTNRVYAVKIATLFKSHNLNITGSTMASDAFFTFTDGIHIAAKIGIRCIIQPGGSIQDAEIIKTANQYGLSMIFTNTRHFRH